MSEHEYVGTELDVFALASNWKAYFADVLRPFISGAVLEVGAGIGATTTALWHEGIASWTCLEPDPLLAARVRELRLGNAGRPLEVIVGTLESVGAERKFDSIIYIDVLEHIQDDRQELIRAAAHLRSGGSLVVLAPAFAFLYSAFDRAIGHYRRYTTHDLRGLTPPGLQLRRTFYLDSLGAALSLANKVLLRQNQPTRRQVLFWDRRVMPLSRVTDGWLGRWWGRSVVAVYGRVGA